MSRPTRYTVRKLIHLEPEQAQRLKRLWHQLELPSESETLRIALDAGMRALEGTKTASQTEIAPSRSDPSQNIQTAASDEARRPSVEIEIEERTIVPDPDYAPMPLPKPIGRR